MEKYDDALFLSDNVISDEGGMAILRNAAWKYCAYLNLENNNIGWKTAVWRVRCPAWTDINVELSGNEKLTIEKINTLIAISLPHATESFKRLLD